LNERIKAWKVWVIVSDKVASRLVSVLALRMNRRRREEDRTHRCDPGTLPHPPLSPSSHPHTHPHRLLHRRRRSLRQQEAKRRAESRAGPGRTFALDGSDRLTSRSAVERSQEESVRCRRELARRCVEVFIEVEPYTKRRANGQRRSSAVRRSLRTKGRGESSRSNEPLQLQTGFPSFVSP
jgi:hypothetical protein